MFETRMQRWAMAMMQCCVVDVAHGNSQCHEKAEAQCPKRSGRGPHGLRGPRSLSCWSPDNIEPPARFGPITNDHGRNQM